MTPFCPSEEPGVSHIGDIELVFAMEFEICNVYIIITHQTRPFRTHGGAGGPKTQKPKPQNPRSMDWKAISEQFESKPQNPTISTPSQGR